MSEKRHNIEAYNMEYSINRSAFTDVLGDPFAQPEPLEGHYASLKKRSSIRVADNNFDSGKATRNTAQPSMTDFFCDVERTVTTSLDKETAQKVVDTYIFEITEDAFTPKERAAIEQTLGKAFRRHKLSPVSKYFTTIRQSVRSNKEGARINGNIAGSTRSRFSL